MSQMQGLFNGPRVDNRGVVEEGSFSLRVLLFLRGRENRNSDVNQVRGLAL